MRVTLDEKITHLRSLLRECESVLVCYSGGVDSAFVLLVAVQELGERAIAMTAVSPSLASFEKDAAVDVAKRLGARHELVASSEIEDPNYVRNHTDRCFYCKSELYRLSALKQKEWGIAYSVNGTNMDDLGDFRPGLEAAKNANVRSVLVEAGFTKQDVRDASMQLGLGIWDKPASACLSSRIPFGTTVTRERLYKVGALEGELRELGFRHLRVRLHEVSGDQSMARIEFGSTEIERAFSERDAIAKAAKRVGFLYATLDLEGYRMGSHNEAMKRALPVIS
ncbi:MAG: ATP-dependent sacrificial sulfur transferase LarE [Polyangiaceae bacterium]|nr:ATP-dependent sacrificial sulfur transferase LarE [Polyangiaceae bacterium]